MKDLFQCVKDNTIFSKIHITMIVEFGNVNE